VVREKKQGRESKISEYFKRRERRKEEQEGRGEGKEE
jgi:hypothetical protein